jgi:hypothetical protein
MKERFIFLVLLGVDALVLFLESDGISISYREAKTLYVADTFLHHLVSTSIALFGQNDVALRLPTIVMHLGAVLLLYRLSAEYLKRGSDRLWLVAIFMLLPGVSSSALLVDNSALVILLLLGYVTLQARSERAALFLLFPAAFIDAAFAPLYLALFFHALNRKSNLLIVTSLLLFGLNMYLHGFDTHGLPKGHFLDTLGLYAVIFSPIVFVYLVYTLFRHFVQRRFSLLWYLAAVPLMLSLLLSFRQVIDIQMFAPYLILALPLAARLFFHSYRVRLKRYRRNYRLLFAVSFALLILNALAVFFNKEIYALLEPGQKHFAHRQHVARELAEALKARGVNCAVMDDRKMQLRLRFYGIQRCTHYRIAAVAGSEAPDVTISYSGYTAYQATVTKIPKK